MTTYRGKTIEGEPSADWKTIYAQCSKCDRFVIDVREYDTNKEISIQQMKYFHAVIVPLLAEYVGCSQLMAELILKKKCGEQWFIKIIDKTETIISKTHLTINQMTKWLENIFDWMESIGCPVPPPDNKWRENQDTVSEF